MFSCHLNKSTSRKVHWGIAFSLLFLDLQTGLDAIFSKHHQETVKPNCFELPFTGDCKQLVRLLSRRFPVVFSFFCQKHKALANEDTLLRTNCCCHKCFPFARARNICCGHKFCVRDTKNVSDFVQKQFVSATNVSQFAQPKKHHEQQCVRNNVSSFARAYNPPTPNAAMPYRHRAVESCSH